MPPLNEMTTSFQRWTQLWKLSVNSVYPEIMERVAGIGPYCPYVKLANVKDRPKHKTGKVSKNAVSSISTRPFHPFSRLPTEIRVKIWENAMPGPRVVTLKCVDFVQMYMNFQEEKYRTVYYVITDTKIPALLHVNKEARSEALSFYNLDFEFWIRGGPIFFDFKRDTLHFQDIYSLRSFLMGEPDAHESKVEEERDYLYDNLRHVMLGGDRLPSFAYEELFQFVQKCDFETLTLQKQNIIHEGSYCTKMLALKKAVDNRELSLVKEAEEDGTKIPELPQLRYLDKHEMKSLVKSSKKEKTLLEQDLFKKSLSKNNPFETNPFKENTFENGFHHVVLDDISARLQESMAANFETTEDAGSKGPRRSARMADMTLAKQQEQ